MNVSKRLHRVRVSDAVAIVLIISLFAGSILVYSAVPSALRIHYTPPGGVYYGVETLPKAIGLFVIPIISAIIYSIMRALPVIDTVDESLSQVRLYYQASIVVTLVLLGLGQAVLISMNVLFA